jgi:hypothetical protein
MNVKEVGTLILAAGLGIIVLAGGGESFAQTQINGIGVRVAQSYFDVATSVQKSDGGYGGPGHSGGAGDALLRIVNKGNFEANPHGFVCANIYVIGDDQQMQECCSCPVSPDGVLTFSTINDLIANPLINNTSLSAGSIKIIGSRQDKSACINGFTAGRIGPTDVAAGLIATINHTETIATNQPPSFGFITSTSVDEFQKVKIDLGEGGILIDIQCFFAEFFGSGAGICKCGAGS